jgi:Arc/MetJ-type ribon-helix-helix transcriptional regulator
MSSQLSPENENYLQYAVTSGLFHDRGEALDKAVELLKNREQLIRDVNRGIEQLERGEGIPFDLEAIKTEVDKKTEF